MIKDFGHAPCGNRMDMAPEEYGAQWSGGIRMAAGVFLVLLAHRGVQPFLDHPAWGARGLGWFILAMALIVGAFLVAIGVGIVVKAALRASRVH